MTTMISGTLIVIAYNMAASILRAFGDGRSPLVAMLIAGLMNIGLDLLFVLVRQSPPSVPSLYPSFIAL